jgi:putative transposase
LGQDQHGPLARLVAERSKTSCAHASWTLVDTDLLGGSACGWHHSTCVFDGPINGESFLLYVEQFLVPTLRRGDIVIMDNLGSHKADAIRQAIAKVGARLLFLPPYSPDLNPIEQTFSKIKNALRKAMGRSVAEVETALKETITAIKPVECRNYFKNAGYASV